MAFMVPVHMGKKKVMATGKIIFDNEPGLDQF